MHEPFGQLFLVCRCQTRLKFVRLAEKVELLSRLKLRSSHADAD